MHETKTNPTRDAGRRAAKRAAGALLLTAWLTAPATAGATELVRVRIGQLDGSEPATISSATHPQLFALDAAIAFAELKATNPAAPAKDAGDPATWFPVMTPDTGSGFAPGTIELTIQPVAGSPVRIGAIAFRTAAQFAANPSSLALRWSQDGFASALDVIDLAQPRSSALAVTSAASDDPTVLRWTAGNDFGDFGGGPAGFAEADIVVSTELCGDAPAAGCAAPGRSSLTLKEAKKENQRRLAWSWAKGTATTADFGDPTVATVLGLCVYEGGSLRSQAAIAPGGECGRKPWWKALAKGAGFAFAQRGGNAAGIAAARLKSGAGKASIAVVGGGPRIALPLPIAAGAEVTVQLVRTDGASCFEAVYPSPAKTSDSLKFVDRIP